MAPSLTRAGLDLSNLDVTSPAELEAFAEFERERRGGDPHPTYQLALSVRPALLKRWFLQLGSFRIDESFATSLTFLHLYLIWGYELGIGYEIRNARAAGHSRAEIADCVGVALLHSPSMGIDRVAGRTTELLAGYDDPATPFSWPDGWRADPTALASGMDFSHPEATAEDLDHLRGWYRRVLGEVPGSVELLAEFRPDLLKQWRNRFEHAATVIPPQMVAYLLLHFEVSRISEDGIREYMLLARGLGMNRTHAMDAVAFGMLYGGPAGMAAVNRVAGDILRSW